MFWSFAHLRFHSSLITRCLFFGRYSYQIASSVSVQVEIFIFMDLPRFHFTYQHFVFMKNKAKCIHRNIQLSFQSADFRPSLLFAALL